MNNCPLLLLLIHIRTNINEVTKMKQSANQSNYQKKKVCFILLMLMMLVITATPAKAMSMQEDRLVNPYGFQARIQPLAMSDTVLDTYSVLTCPFNSSHNRSLYQPTYKTISFHTSYSRKNPDEKIGGDGLYASPICGHVVNRDIYKCNYYVW